MSYTLSVLVQLGLGSEGKTLLAELADTQGVSIETDIDTGFVELEAGDYLWTHDMPDNFRGAALFYDAADASYLTAMSVNPQEHENADVIASSILAQVSTAVVEVKSPILESGHLELIQGDDYTYANGRPLLFQPTNPDAWPAVVVGDMAVLGVGGDDYTEFEADGTVTSDDPKVISIEVEGADTANSAKGRYGYTLRLNGTTKATVATGVCVLRKAWG